MGLLSSAYYMSKMAERYLPSIKDVADKLMDKYTSSISTDTWAEKVADVDTDGLSYVEKKENKELALQVAEMAEGQCGNFAEAVQQDPVAWGTYMESKGLTQEKVAELQAQAEENGGEGIPPFELLKMSIGSGASQGEPQQDEPQAGTEATTEAENSVTEPAVSADDRTAQQVAELGDLANIGEPSFGTEVTFENC